VFSSIAAVIALLLNFVACSSSSPHVWGDRLADHDRDGKEFTLVADGTVRRILNPLLSEHVFTIGPTAPGARFLFVPGIEKRGAVLFDVIWTSESAPSKTIYHRELSAPGWSEEEITLPSDGPGELRLCQTVPPGGSEILLQHAGWGDPTILSGQASGRTSVILISLDTLRADRLGIHGRREARTPVLDALAAAGVRYERAYSASTWTRPSHQSLLYGIQPRALPGTAFHEVPPEGWKFDTFESVAEAFRRAGYLTAAFTGGGFVAANLGLGRGFDTYFMYAGGSKQPGTCDPARFDGAEVFSRATRWLRRRAGAPFFLFVHTYEPHDRCPVTPARKQHFKPWTDVSPAERQALIDYYDDVVARTDDLVGTLLRELDTLGLADSTIVAVTSDHGEGLGEHDVYGHGCDLPPYEWVSHVPLIVRLPTRRSARIDTPVSNIDLAPTLLRLADVPIPRTMHGSVLPGLGLRSDPNPLVYVHCGNWLSVRKGDDKLIVSRGGEPKLFSTRDDPEELTDLNRHQHPAEDDLRQRAREYWASTPKAARRAKPVTRGNLGQADVERLRALGYVE
jgi:arylsulfatase A-like enzyme